MITKTFETYSGMLAYERIVARRVAKKYGTVYTKRAKANKGWVLKIATRPIK